VAQQPTVGQDLLIIEASRSHSDAPHYVGLLWTSDQPVAQRLPPDKTQHSQETFMPRRDSNPRSQQAGTNTPENYNYLL